MFCFFTLFQNVHSQLKNTIPISGKAFNEKYIDRQFDKADFDSLIKLSVAFSGLPKFIQSLNPSFGIALTEIFSDLNGNRPS